MCGVNITIFPATSYKLKQYNNMREKKKEISYG